MLYYLFYMGYRDIVTIDPKIRGGQPTIRGMRITVYDVLKMLASGMNHQEIIADFPELTDDDIQAALSYASHREGGITFASHEAAPRSKHLA
jgi:uncharacterized protein (DUF433 family)